MADRPLRFSTEATDDLDSIWDYSAARWGTDQAERYSLGLKRSFQTIASMPEIGRENPEFDPPVRILSSAEHLIVYLDREDEILVVRVLGGRQNWRQILNG